MMKPAPCLFACAVALAACPLAGAFAQPAPEGSERRAERVEVCHFDARTGAYSLLAVPSRAADKHLRHGDCLVDDGVDCTIDRCDAEAGCVHALDDSACDDGVFCNGIESCSPKGCVAISSCPPVVLDCGTLTCDEDNDACVIVPDDAACDDENPCTDDACVEGSCVSTPDDTNSCEDGLFCNGVAECQGGSCVAVSACPPVVLECGELACDEENDACVIVPSDADCEDGVDCTVDTCDAEGNCSNVPDDSACDDGLFCNGTESCSPEGCVAISACPPVLLECGALTCDEDNDTCVIVPNDEECNTTDQCVVGRCTGEGMCAFDPVPACTFTSTSLCDDGNPDTLGDEQRIDSCTGEPCSDCAGELVICGDGSRAGSEGCDDGNTTPGDGCSATCEVEPCFICEESDNGFGGLLSMCTDVVSLGLCDDGIDCTVNSCDPATGECRISPNDAACDDGLFCNGMETCEPEFGGCVFLGCASGPEGVCGCQVSECGSYVCNEEADQCDFIPIPACSGPTESAPCDDGDPNTQFDEQVIDSCTGEPCGPCEGVSP